MRYEIIFLTFSLTCAFAVSVINKESFELLRKRMCKKSPDLRSCIETRQYDPDSEPLTDEELDYLSLQVEENKLTETPTKVPVCEQPTVVGPCHARIPRWSYNRETGLCEEFYYGGCEGNNNNFVSYSVCQSYCRSGIQVTPRPRSEVPICEQPKEIGPCKAYLPRFFYNQETASCEVFVFGGCGGNNNNFKSESECLIYCQRRSPELTETPTKVPVCEQPTVVGPCHARIPRWSYNRETGLCEEFYYGGCEGNNNNFVSYSVCQSYCRSGIQVDVCSLDFKPTSQCSIYGTNSSWYYDKSTGMCSEIAKGECNSNRNNFQSYEQCEQYCSRGRVCQPLTYSTTIRCLALGTRWTYDSRSRSCESFIYGGCGGSANNFDSKEACDRKCEPRAVEPVTRAPEPMPRLDDIRAGNKLVEEIRNLEDGLLKRRASKQLTNKLESVLKQREQ